MKTMSGIVFKYTPSRQTKIITLIEKMSTQSGLKGL